MGRKCGSQSYYNQLHIIKSNHRSYSRFISKKYFRVVQKNRKTSEMRLWKINKLIVLLFIKESS